MAKTITQLPDATSVADADELIVQQSGITKRATKLEVIAGIKNASIASDAAIAFSKLAALDSANILVGNGSNVATKVAVTGDVTISNAGVTAIGNNKVVTAMITDANVTPAKLSQPLTLATAQNASSNNVEFTGIPSWVKRITVMFNGVSANGTAALAIRAGTSSGLATSGYTSACASIDYSTTNTTNGSGSTMTDSFRIDGYTSTAASAIHGSFVLTNVSGNVWAGEGTFTVTGVARVAMLSGTVSLGGTLDRVAIVANVVSSQSFDAGSVNIMYEG
jgi:hypothetical protein